MAQSPRVEEAEALKQEGNDLFRAKHFAPAEEKYRLAIEKDPSQPALYSNKAFCAIKLEEYGTALADATKAIELDSTFFKAYYRRGTAYFFLSKYREALLDFQRLHKMKPSDADVSRKLKECEREFRREQFEKAIATEHGRPLSETLKIADYAAPPADYDGVRWDGGVEEPITKEFVHDMVERFRKEKTIPKRYMLKMLLQSHKMLSELPSLVDVSVPEGERITVCGDTHGQFYDVLNIFDLNGLPSPQNPYLFNGDFVDRGSFSCEVILTFLAYKLLYPDAMHLTRGNHESTQQNKVYGFEGEVKHKYGEHSFELFQEVFRWLPLCYCLNQKVIVVHGGLFSRDNVTLDDLRRMDRNREPPEDGDMCDALWADPQKNPGRGMSKRGVSMCFGPDITKRFLDANGLKLVIRSHEVKEEGYEVEADGRLITIFSAPNYCDQMGNKGAFIHLGHDMEPKFTQFSAVPHPNVKPMAYSSHRMFM